MRLLFAYFIGLIFGVGIAISGMANPAKVINFFDLAGSWDPSLVFVMGGALVTTFIGYKFILARPAPLLSDGFKLPMAKTIDARLIGGAAIFGIGWGLAGFCPGGSLPALGTGRIEVFLFTGAMIAGILLTKLFLPSATAKA